MEVICVNIVVLCGGLSPERNVSISSGVGIAAALRSLGHRAALIDMYLGLEAFESGIDGVYDAPLPDNSHIAAEETDLDAVRASRRLKSSSLFGEGVLELCRDADLVFLALHGQCGEDGRVQAAFDLMGIRYTGSGYLGSALAMDKHLAKLCARSVGVLTANWRFFTRGELTPDTAETIPLPCVVKPVDSGSSIGVTIVRDRASLAAALDTASNEGSGVLVEDFIAGREIQISVLGGVALPSIEIRPGGGFYGYREKYVPGASIEVTPAPIPPETERDLAAQAVAIYKALGLSGLARADFILDDNGRLWFLEINTLPGMTPTSLAPQEAAAVGISYEQLCERLIELALNDTEVLP